MNKQKIILTSTIVLMVVASATLGRIMSKNMSKDVTKLRTSLTKEYKFLKDNKYIYSPQKGLNAYQSLCMDCHGNNGMGVHGVPSLVYKIDEPLLKEKMVGIVLNGKGANMPSHYNVPHGQVADALTYIRQALNGEEDVVVSPLDLVVYKVKYLKEN